MTSGTEALASTPWGNNAGPYQTPGGFQSSFDSSGPPVDLELQGGCPQFGGINFTDDSVATQ